MRGEPLLQLLHLQLQAVDSFLLRAALFLLIKNFGARSGDSFLHALCHLQLLLHVAELLGKFLLQCQFCGCHALLLLLTQLLFALLKILLVHSVRLNIDRTSAAFLIALLARVLADEFHIVVAL